MHLPTYCIIVIHSVHFDHFADVEPWNGHEGTEWRSAEGFRIYVPTSIIGSPSLDGLSGALWEGFSAASDPETAATFWTAVATFCYTEAQVLTRCLAVRSPGFQLQTANQ